MVQQGIQSLMPQQAPMPGQAPQAPMQGMMPKPSAATPPPMGSGIGGTIDDVKRRIKPLLMQNPPPPYSVLMSQIPISANMTAVIAGISAAKKEADLERSAQNNAAMQNNAQMGQGSVAQDMLASLRQELGDGGQQPAAQGYAGGGAVAFQDGGAAVQHFKDGSDENGVQSFMSRFPKDSGARMLYEWIKAGRPPLEKPILDALFQKEQEVAESTTDTGDERSRMLGRAPAPVPMTMQDTRGVTPDTVAAARNLGTGIAQGQNRPQVPPAAAPTDTGLAGLMGPTIDPGMLGMRGAVDERQAAIRNAAKTPEAVLKARGGIDALMKEIVDSRRAEEQRLMTHSDKRLEEARARAAQSPLNDISYLGQMLEGMRGSKRFGEALAGAASGAGRAQTARSQALQAAEDRYDLSRRDIFNLANLRQQVQLDQAKLAEARATGDADRANKAALDLAQSKEALAKFEMDVSNKSREMGLEERKLTQQGQIAREQMTNALKVAGMQADRTPAEVRLMEWLRNPENKKLYESIQASKRAEDRNLKLYEIYMKNKLLLGDMSFETFTAGLKDASTPGAAPGGALKYNPATGKIE